IYIGAPVLGARKAAANTLDDIAQVVDYAHRFGVRVYVTVNTIIYDNELPTARQLVFDLWRIGVDALIVQDMALLELDLPPIALHASTQCDTRTPEKARMLAEAGFSQIVLARELSAEEISRIHDQTAVPLEAFVHGALCVSYSGDCQASWAITRRSANRGECAQVCRMLFDLEDSNGKKIICGKHLLSLRDLNRIADIAALLESGVSSLKIEGRLKETAYVKNVVAAYRQAIDDVIASAPDKYRRSSAGRSLVSFVPDLSKSFNRTYTPYFLHGAPASVANINTPKWAGEEIGTVKKSGQNVIFANLTATLTNGDGLGFFNADGIFEGFRLNRVEGDRLFPARNVTIKPGTRLYRNSDVAWNRVMAANTATRVIDISLTLRPISWGIALDAEDECGIKVTSAVAVPHTPARTDQLENRRRILAKSGDTIFSVKTITDDAGNMFIPASVLTTLRRDTLQQLVTARMLNHRTQSRVATSSTLTVSKTLTRHDNVANRLAEKFYRTHGATVTSYAIETDAENNADELRVMECRYCIRRELGACLKKADQRSKLPRDLFLTTANHRFRLEFDCKACLMRLWYQNK
ncbi:MAG: U32 family peptidase, partial [Muribaculaceae bacterium]|nr:U32 family peptidase [Muribaculaceae bacterium]